MEKWRIFLGIRGTKFVEQRIIIIIHCSYIDVGRYREVLFPSELIH